MTARLSLRQRLTECSTLAMKAMQRAKDRGDNRISNYQNGQAVAFIDAEKMVREELHRLRNLWQNGAITFNDFDPI